MRTAPPPQPGAPARLRGWRGATVLALSAIVGAAGLLLAIELIAAQVLARRGAPSADEVPGDFVPRTLTAIDLAPAVNPTPLRADPALLWRNASNATRTQFVNPMAGGRLATWTIVTDAAGRRGPPVGPRDPARYRVLCIGDSITFGFNVDQDAPFPRQLETLLAARWPGHAFEVVNAGVPGWSWAQGVRYLETEGLALDPDVVVMAHGTNDQFYPVTTTDLEHLGATPGRLARLLTPLRDLVQSTHTARLLAARARGAGISAHSPGCQEQRTAPGGCRRVSVPQIERLVRDARAATRAADVDLIVLNVDFMATRAVAGVRAAVAAEGLPFLDVVARVDALRAADETARTARLGLAPAGPLATAPAADGTRPLVLRVTDLPPGTQATATGQAEFIGTFAFDVPLHDGGTDGDEVAGDGVHSATVRVPPRIPVIGYRFVRDGAPEFVPLPPVPSTQGIRAVTMRDAQRLPVAEYGRLFLMQERTHPDAAGHAVIAEALVDLVAGLPSLRAFLARGAGGS